MKARVWSAKQIAAYQKLQAQNEAASVTTQPEGITKEQAIKALKKLRNSSYRLPKALHPK